MSIQSELLSSAAADWLSGRAYIDGHGNYHLRVPGRNSGPIASWNRVAKALFPNAEALHKYAHGGAK